MRDESPGPRRRRNFYTPADLLVLVENLAAEDGGWRYHGGRVVRMVKAKRLDDEIKEGMARRARRRETKA